MNTEKEKCVNCLTQLIEKNGVKVCLKCNTETVRELSIFKEEKLENDYVFIECPGATLYADDSNEIVAGAKFKDRDDPSAGYEIIDRAVYSPTHKKKRRVKKDQIGKISRCQGCQDYTVRMRRKEGVDFFIPSTKYPGRKKLKTVQHVTYEP